MKYLNLTSISCGMMLLLGATAASADVVKDPTSHAPIVSVAGGNSANQNYWTGSDTLEGVVGDVMAGLTLLKITTYNGQGSGQGQRQLEGNPKASTDEPTCTPTDSDAANELNPGCQEIAPMSSKMDNGVCDDDFDVTVNSTNVSAEDLAVCADGVSVMTNNLTSGQYADSLAACPNGVASPNGTTGFVPSTAYAGAAKVRRSGTAPSGYVYGANGTGWKDVLRLLYTGCKHDQGDCSTIDRNVRCSDPARVELVNRWDYLVESGVLADSTDAPGMVDCTAAGANPATAKCATGTDGGVRQAYRRDDASGTTKVFAQFLGLNANATFNVGRTRLASNTALTPIPQTHLYCDGGETEGFFSDGVTAGDPLTKPCKAEDNLCNASGRMGIVHAIRSPHGATAFPTLQCTRGSFAYKTWLNSSFPICPDGTKPKAGACKLPYFAKSDGTKDFNCLNDLNSRPASAPNTTDGRCYNAVNRDSAGNVSFLSGGTLPDVAQWRMQMATLKVSNPVAGGVIGTVAGTKFVCNDADATRIMGCVLANTTCTVGYAGREAAYTDPFASLQDPLRIDPNGTQDGTPSDANINAGPTTGYPMSRDLYLAASGGFGHIYSDCIARGGADGYCRDEVTIANAFHDNTSGSLLQNACIKHGLPIKPSQTCLAMAKTLACTDPAAASQTPSCVVEVPPAP